MESTLYQQPSTLTQNTPFLTRLNTLRPFVGNTPLFPIEQVYKKTGVQIYAKLEWHQLGGSVKARAAFEIFQNAILSGEVGENRALLDASSGNTGIAYATIGQSLNIPVSLCIPENASDERKKILNALGAELIYTSALGTTDEAQDEAVKLKERYPENYFYADQYSNPSNWQAHYQHTAPEVLNQTGGQITHFVSGLGTTGTFTGTAKRLKEENPNIHLTSLQPNAPMHGLEGWKHLETAHVPQFYDPELADQNIEIDSEKAFELVKKVARTEGLLISPSSAANLLGAIQVAQQIDHGTIVTVFPDNLEKYGKVMNHLFN